VELGDWAEERKRQELNRLAVLKNRLTYTAEKRFETIDPPG
jgi:hypothetical protein